MARVVLEHLCKAYKGPKGAIIRAVHDLSLGVEDGELLALVGPSGCGKTTMLRLIAGLEAADGGAVFIDGQAVNQIAPKGRDVAMVFQNHALFPHLTVFENIAFGLKLRKLATPEIERRVKEAAEMLGLASCLDRLPNALSGGQQQRVAVGRAIVRRPKLFLLDEPLSNLDAPLRVQMRREIARLHRRLGIATIYVTHDQAEAMALGNRVAVMNEGVVQQIERPLDVYHRPANLFVAGFVGSPPMNLFHGVIASEGGGMRFKNGKEPGDRGGITIGIDEGMVSRLSGFVNKPVVLGLRAEEILPAAAGTATATESTVKGAVLFVEALGSETHVHLAVGTDEFAACWRDDLASFASRERLAVLFDMRKARFFDPGTGKAIV
ncbi:MAG TPA: ABC transporter ATP-binding protein [Verrucomicrobiae bacterium]|nr:ABC transporter ATP-binding protein [Verrucomicrobiae bacterium]